MIAALLTIVVGVWIVLFLLAAILQLGVALTYLFVWPFRMVATVLLLPVALIAVLFGWRPQAG